MEGHPLHQQLEQVFALLGSADAAKEKEGSHILRNLVEEEGEILFHRSHALNVQSKALKVYLTEHLRALFSNPSTRLGGVYAVDALMNVEYCELHVRTTQFFNLLTKAVTDSSRASVEAARAWGSLLSRSALAAEVVEAQAQQVIEWLSIDSKSSRKLVACLFLTEMTKHAPTQVTSRIEQLLQGLWWPLKDPVEETRLAGAETLKSVLFLAMKSPSVVRDAWLNSILSLVVKYFSIKQPEVVHGALLAFSALLEAASDTTFQTLPVVAFNPSEMDEAWRFIIDGLQKAPMGLRKQIVEATPLLAKYDKIKFTQKCYGELFAAATMAFRGNNMEEKTQMFLVLGKLASSLGPDATKLYLQRLIANIENNLISNKKAKRERCEAAVSCLAMLASAQPTILRPYVLPLTEALFSGHPTVAFAKDISSLCTVFPELQSMYMENLLRLVRDVLHTHPNSVQQNDENQRQVLGVLETLQATNFGGFSVLPFLMDELVDYLTNSSDRVRLVAADLCASLMFSGCLAPGSPCAVDTCGTMVHKGRSHINLIGGVQRHLLSVAVADVNSDIRFATLEKLTVRFDHTLSHHDAIRSLLPALNDRHANRQAALKLLGRLSRRNPAAVFPTLRKVMIQCTMELQYFNNVRKQEQATITLGTLVESAPTLVRPYTPALLEVVTAKLKNPSTSNVVLTALLSTVGKLALQVREADLHVVRDLKKMVVDHIRDGSSLAKKQEAMRALGNIVRATRDVAVYEEFPELLDDLVGALHGGFKEGWPVRQDVLSLMGIIGAVDPIRIKHIMAQQQPEVLTLDENTSALMGGAYSRPRSEDAICQVVVSEILQVLKQPSLPDEACSHAVSALVQTFTSRAMKMNVALLYVSKVISELLKQIRLRPDLCEKLFKELTQLVSVLRHFVRPHLEEIMQILPSYLSGDSLFILYQVLLLLQELRQALNEEFKPHLPSILPLLVQAVMNDASEKKETASRVFACFEQFGRLLEGYLHVVLPCVLDVISKPTNTIDARTRAIATILSFAKQLSSISDHAARCIHCLCQVITEDIPVAPSAKPVKGGEEVRVVHPLHHEALTALSAIVQNLGDAFMKFLPTVRTAMLARFGVNNQAAMGFFLTCEQASTSGRRHIPTLDTRSVSPQGRNAEEAQLAESRDFASLCSLLQSMDRAALDDDWTQWIRQFALECLRSSPSKALRVCETLARAYDVFARQLFHPAFASCYSAMNSETKAIVIRQLGLALRNPKIPSEVLQELLNLAEYMERTEEVPLSTEATADQPDSSFFSVPTLAERSESCNLHAKALHYAETQFLELTRSYENALMVGKVPELIGDEWKAVLAVCQKGIHLCNMLGQPESANGILAYVQRIFNKSHGQSSHGSDVFSDPDMYEKLMWWSESLKAHRERLAADPKNVAHAIGVLKALDAQGDVQKLLEQWRVLQKRLSRPDLPPIALYGARAAWLLQSWDDMEEAVKLMTGEGYVQATALFYSAVISLHKGSIETARDLVTRCRANIDRDLSALVGESYDRAYRLIVSLQQLSELEEIANVLERRESNDPEVRTKLSDLWRKRLMMMAPDPIEWQGTLANHTLVLNPRDNLDMWLHFVSLSRMNGRQHMSEDVLTKLLQGDISTVLASNAALSAPPSLIIAAASHIYEVSDRSKAMQLLEAYTHQLDAAQDPKREAAASCHALLGEWIAATVTDFPLDQHVSSLVLENFRKAADLDPTSVNAWHSWALANQRLAATQSERGHRPQNFEPHIVGAVDGYLNSICSASQKAAVDDILGFLSLWFTYGNLASVDSIVQTGISKVDVNVWLAVIPQIIARLHTPFASVKQAVHVLLVAIAKAHPQVVLYPLYVYVNGDPHASGDSDIAVRREAAVAILEELRVAHGEEGRLLTSQAQMVSRELIRCAVLWPEVWYAELEEIWKRWVTDGDPDAMRASLDQLHNMLHHPETGCEEQFKSEYGKTLAEAYNFIADYRTSHKQAHISQAWEIYTNVYLKIERLLPSMNSLNLNYVSPVLEEKGRKLKLVVPGQYHPSKEYPTIERVVSSMKVLPTKQRPRRIVMLGSNGEAFKFLLKGNEDLRQDERVMQVLKLVNTMLEKNASTAKKDLFTVPYAVTPLNDNAGLCGWLEQCDTVNSLMREYRESHKIAVDIERQLMNSMVMSVDTLALVQKIEVFEYALENTDSLDLARIMWLRSPNAEIWLDRRTAYIRTLATMSMVGHIIGLGDRHPSNLMLHQQSGKIIHIDFGDCFEVAMLRPLHPEKVPFRLTRMTVKAMEVSGIDGLFRHSSEAVMNVLRQEKNSLMAMLEAFVHDPLLSWRLTTDEQPAATAPAAAPMQSPAETSPDRPQVMPIQDTDQSAGSIKPSIRESMRHRAIIKTVATHTKRALMVVNRTRQKLEGREFNTGPAGIPKRVAGNCPQPEIVVGVAEQVSRLIEQATSNENLCQCWVGWCPFW